MKKSINRVMIMLLAFVSALCFVFAIATANLKITKAATTQEVEPQFSIVKSAQVYTGAKDDSTGIRFSATLNSQWLSQKVEEIGDETPIYFGIELSVDNNKDTALDFCYTASQEGITGFKKIDFETANEFTYNAALMYNKKTLATELFDRHSDSFETLEEFMQSALFEKYLQAAYKTEITAVAYYQVGGTEVAKNYIGDSATYSIFGVGSKVYSGWDSELDGSLTNDETGDFILVGKYFSSASKVDAKVYLQENGEIIGYNAFNETDLVYVNAKPTEVEEYETGKFKIKDTSMLDGIDVRDKKVITIATISDAGVLTTVQADYVTMIIDEASDFEVFDLDTEYTLQDGTILGEVVNGYFVMTEDIDAQGTNLGLDHEKYMSGSDVNGRYNVKGSLLGVGFTGVFDGQGHVIKNFVPGVGGLFGRLAQGSSVSGIGFYNATLNASTNLIAYNGKAERTVDNDAIPEADANTTFGGLTLLERNNLIKDRSVYINMRDIYAKLSSETTDVNGVITKNDRYDSNVLHTNIVIDASDCIVGNSYSFFLKKDTGATMNQGYIDAVVIITNKGAITHDSSNIYYGGNQNVEAANGIIKASNVSVYENYTQFIGDSEIAKKFTSNVWNTENGVMFKALEKLLVKDYIYVKDNNNKLYSSKIETDNTELSLTAVDLYGNALTISDFTSSDNSVIDFVDGVIKVVNYVIGEYTVSFNVLLDGESITCNRTIELVGEIINVASEAIYDSAENKVYYTDAQGETVIVDGNVFYIDSASNEYALSANSVSYLSKTAFSFQYNYKGMANYAMLDKMTPTITGVETSPSISYSPVYDTYSGVKIRVEKGIKVYTFANTILANAVIDTGKELQEIFNKADIRANGIYTGDANTIRHGTITKGVYMLADDIDADKTKEDGFKFNNSYFNFFEGVFDGRGHTISNLDVSATGVDNDYGNGLFSAISTFSSIQNVGFINVKADNGAVFMGNLGDRPNGTYMDSPKYLAQLGLPEDGDIKTVLASVYRAGEARGLNNWSNVYVEVSRDTSKLMGVIARNMPNKVGTVRGNNLVIKYDPKDMSAYSTYTNGSYGVLFGGAYTLSAGGTYKNCYYEAPHGYALYNTASATRYYYTPTSTKVPEWTNLGGALNYSCDLLYNTSAAHKTYVISPVKLVSCVSGAILGTNESLDDVNIYQFVQQASSSVLARFENENTATTLMRNSYATSTAGFDKYWTINENGYMVWKNA